MTDIDKIIAGMSARRREILCRLPITPLHPDDIGASQATLKRMAYDGLAEAVKCWPRYGSRSFTGYCLSPFGLAVRNRLKEQDNA